MNNRRRLRIIATAAVAGCLAIGPARLMAQPTLGAWIDPGHGDGCAPVGAPGFNGNTAPDEKDLNLAVATKVMNRLGALGYPSALIRTSDRCVSVNDRPLIAAGLKDNGEGITEEASVFVSIHMDGDPDPAVKGTFVIYPAKNMRFRKSNRSYRVDSTLASFVNGPLQSNAAAAFIGCNDPKPLRQDIRGLAVVGSHNLSPRASQNLSPPPPLAA